MSSYKKLREISSETTITTITPSQTQPQRQKTKPQTPQTPTPQTPTPQKLHLDYVIINSDSGNPEVWGPAFWFSLHNGADKYPIKATPIWKERMKNFIMGIPVMLPCEKCSVHATSYIEKNKHLLDIIVDGRTNLFEFFVTFHNDVNKRLKKPEVSLKDAYSIYSLSTKTTKLKMKIY